MSVSCITRINKERRQREGWSVGSSGFCCPLPRSLGVEPRGLVSALGCWAEHPRALRMSGVSRGYSEAGKSRDSLERRGCNRSVCSCHLPLLCLSPKPSFPSVSEWRMWPRTLHYKRGITHISRFWGLVTSISVLKNGVFMWIVKIKAAVLRWNPLCYI